MRKNTEAVMAGFMASAPRGQRGGSIWTDGNAIYSYETCLVAPLADRTGFVLNSTKYTPTTNTHQKAIRGNLLVNIPVELENVPMGTNAETLAALGAAKKAELLDPAQGAF